MIVIIIIVAIILIICLINILPFFNTYYFKINNLLKTNTINKIENKTNLLDYPINQFMINSSHNTYLNFIQHVSITTCGGIKFALEAGAKCIEIDINKIYNDNPIVAHGTDKFITTSYIKLENILDCIISYGLNTSDPLFICVEMPILNNDNINKQVKEIFLDKFKNTLLLTQNGVDFTQLPIRNLLNKVILIGSVDNNGILKDIIHDSNNFNNMHHLSDSIKNKNINNNSMTRIYPSGNFWSALSYNYDPTVYRKHYHNIIALNFQTRDKYLYDNLIFFKNYSFVHKSEFN